MNFFSSIVYPYQYFARVELMSSHQVFGILKMPIVYVRIACTTVLISIFHLAFEINFSFHPITHLVIFSLSPLKALTLDFPTTTGKPRYFSQSVMTWTPNIPWMISLTSALVFLLKNRAVLSLFIAWPNALSYCLRMVTSCWHSSIDAWKNSKLSLADSRWEIWSPFLQDRIPYSWFLSFALCSMADIPSTHIRNK